MILRSIFFKKHDIFMLFHLSIILILQQKQQFY